MLKKIIQTKNLKEALEKYFGTVSMQLQGLTTNWESNNEFFFKC